MSSNLKHATLSSIADILMGQSPSGETCNVEGVGIPLLNGPSEFGTYHPTPVQFTTDSRKLAKKSDLLFCVRGSTTGRMNWADQNYSIGRGLAALRHKNGLEYQPYLKALIETILPGLLSSATGSTFPNVSRDQLLGAKVFIHSLDQQLAISRVLSSLDEKIELNRQICKTLENIASTLFKSWFIDFDPVKAKAAGQEPEGLSPETAALFPDSFIDSILGQIPQGWYVGKIKDIALQIKTAIAPLNYSNEKFYHYSLPSYDKDKIPAHDLGSSIKSNKTVISQKCILLSKLNPEIPRVWLPQQDETLRSICSTEFLAYEPKGYFSRKYLYCFFLEPSFRLQLQGMVTGTSKSHQRVQPAALLSIDCVVPSKAVLNEFKNVTKAVFEKIQIMKHQTSILTKIRDTLLPKLINGEIKVQEAETLIAASI
jgi:type I restriction enzyme S subunit